MASAAETLQRISKHKGVMGVVIAGSDGQIHKTTLGEQDTHDIVGQLPMLSALARNMVRELDPQDELEFLRVRSLKHEIMVAPKGDYVMIVVQEAVGGQ